MASKTSASSSSVGSLVLAEPLPAVRQKPLRQVRKDREEDAVLEPFAEPLGVLAAAAKDDIEPAPFGLGHRLEGVGPEEQPPVAEGFVGVGVAGGGERLDEIDLVEVRGPCVGLAAVKSPLAGRW